MTAENRPQTILVFGTGPYNIELDPFVRLIQPFIPKSLRGQKCAWNECMERAELVLDLVKSRNISAILCIGAERIPIDANTILTEAELMKNTIENLAFLENYESLPEIKLEDKGRETLEQIDYSMALLGEETDNMIVVTSWHQMPRVLLILKLKHNIFDTNPIAANSPNKDSIAYDVWNCAAGYCYTLGALLMQKLGFCQDGGPVISYYRQTRV